MKFSGCPIFGGPTNTIAIPKDGKQAINVGYVSLKSLVDTKCGQVRHQILPFISHPFVFPFQNNEVIFFCIFLFENVQFDSKPLH